MSVESVTRIRRALLVLCTLALIWAALLDITSGFVVRLGPIRITSRNPLNPFLIALLSGLAACVLARPDLRRRLREDLSWSAGVLAVPWRLARRLKPADVIALAGMGFAIYRWYVARPMWLDEEMIALNLRDRSFGDLAGALWLGQSAPLGWMALQRVVVLTGGTSEFALRLVPMLGAVATLAVALWAGRRWMGQVGASVFVLLCSIGTWMSHYQLELKHYSADMFWALLLTVFAARASEADEPSEWTRRIALWWSAAVVGQWFAHGALLVAPGCALVLLAMAWLRYGLRAAITVTLFGIAWLVSFGLHYGAAIRHALNSEFLTGYWASSLPAASIGAGETLKWLGGQFEPLALKPIDTQLWVPFWVSAACGFAFAIPRALGVFLATVPLSAFALAALRLVPLGDRLSLWCVPALYFGIALFVDRGIQLGREGYGRREWTRLTAASVIVFVGAQPCFDIIMNGTQSLRVMWPSDSNHSVDDRSAVRWLMDQRQQGDVLLTTHLAMPALWWYGEIPLSGSNSPGSRHPDGNPMFEVGYADSESECQTNQLQGILKGRRRVLAYSGFPDMPTGFDVLLFDSLDELGAITARRDFAQSSRAAVIDLRMAHNPKAVLTGRTRAGGSGNNPKMLDGCVVIRPAGRW
jgi:hypothetical protein